MIEIADKHITTEFLPIRITTVAPEFFEFCDVSHPNKEHPSDCQLFYQCVSGTGEWVEKSCGPQTYYNPLTQVCDFIAAVIAIKPECSKSKFLIKNT